MKLKYKLSLLLTAPFLLSYGQKAALEDFETESVVVKEKTSVVERLTGEGSALDQGVKLSFIEDALGVRQDGFTPRLKYGVGMVLETVVQQIPRDGSVAYPEGYSSYNFQPAAFKIGFLHTDMEITPKLSASMTWNLHSSKITDAFIKYNFHPLLNVQLGRFKGAGNRAANETSAYDIDLIDFTYTSENQSTDQGAPDLRHYGINFAGQWKWIRYGFFWHNSDSNRDRYWSGFNDGPESGQGNHGLEFKSWDLSLRFFPVKNVEFGGHTGSVNLPGMGYRTAQAWSAFAYYVDPGKYKIKFDFGAHQQIRFNEAINNMDYTRHDFTRIDKLGWSVLLGYNVTSRIEPAVRFESYNQGDKWENGLGYNKLNLYTVGVNFYVYPKSPRMGKITAFYQHRDERGMIGGGKGMNNDWFGLSYQIVLYNNTQGVF